jgi:hypothetical protein
MIACSSCGNQNDDDARVCTSCGVRLWSNDQARQDSFQNPTRGAPSMGSSTNQAPPPYRWENNSYTPPSAHTPPPPPPAPAPPLPVAPYAGYQYSGYQQAGYMPMPQQSSGLATTCMVMGIIVLCLFILGLIPCLGWINWINLPIAGITDILSFVVIVTEGKNQSSRNKAIMGLIFSFLALVIGSVRLVLGGGCV